MFRQHQQNLTSSNIENKTSLLSTRNSNYRTPARSLKHGKVVQDENTIYAGTRTAGLTNRKKHDISFSTPPIYRHLNKAAPVFGTNNAALTEITNQTPFVKHFPATPGPTSSKLQQSFAVFNDDFAAPSARRISSTRKKLKLPRSENKKFETPETRGDHWDVSDASTEASMTEEVSITEEDYDDVEYAPPTAIDAEFDPGFDMPDYKVVGATLMSLFRQPIIADVYDTVTSIDDTCLDDIGPFVCEELGLCDGSPDDIFSLIGQVDTACHSTAGSSEVPGLLAESLQFTSSGSRPGPVTKAKISTLNARASDISKSSSAGLLSKPHTRRAAVPSHTRIPSLSKPRMAHAPPPARQTATAASHPKNMHGRVTTTSIPPKATRTTRTKPPNLPLRTANSSNLVTTSTPIDNRKSTIHSQQSHVPHDTVLSLLADFADEALEGDFLFKV